MKFSFREYVFLRENILRKLNNILSKESKVRARSDWHARRQPRPCGLTVHSALGCTNACVYCYIQDMGFDYRRAKPYGLSGEEIVYAIISNRFFVPGKYGTYLAYGSITEPFLTKEITSKTIEYISATAKFLGNPMQISTKSFIDEHTAGVLKKVTGLKPLSVLVTLLTLREGLYKKLEPRASPPLNRLKTIRNLSKRGLPVFVFYRPLIPGVLSAEDFEETVNEAKRHGALGVVVGGFRVTANIIERFEKLGLNTIEIKRRVKRALKNHEQVSLALRDLKEEFLKIAREKGLIVVKTACCANTISFKCITGEIIPCAGLCYLKNMCTSCSLKCYNHLPKVVEDDLIFAINYLLKENVTSSKIDIRDKSIAIMLSKRAFRRAKRRKIRIILETIYRRKVIFLKS
ncbi:MAG: radical SAM protein [Thermoprotei archaeon]|nr:MAG: radical SAM protein [Thermoprotei archaeon]RLF00408.1 MAG: radical SAM protein [Thermoprotei archaeon]